MGDIPPARVARDRRLRVRGAEKSRKECGLEELITRKSYRRSPSERAVRLNEGRRQQLLRTAGRARLPFRVDATA